MPANGRWDLTWLLKGKKKLQKINMSVLFFPTAFVCNISHSKEQMSETGSKMYIGLHVKCPLFSCDCNET
jgi:hypothetical protein